VIVIQSELIYSDVCNNKEDIYPCFCNSNNWLVCWGSSVKDKNMKNFFRKAFESQTFSALYINDTELTTIQQIGGLLFQEIHIENNRHLEYINSSFFNQSNEQICVITINNNPLLSDMHRGTDSLLKSITNVNPQNGITITLNNNNLKHISDHTFENISSSYYSYGTTLNLMNNNIKSIGNYAFNNITITLSIDLSHNGIEIIKSYAFNNLYSTKLINLSHNAIETLPQNSFNNFWNNIYIDLSFNRIKMIEEFAFNLIGNMITIDLKYTKLRSEAMRKNSFNVTDGTLDLRYNHLQQLPRKVFNPFFNLSSNNVLNVENNDFYCDCHSKWILLNTNPRFNINGMLCTIRDVYIYELSLDDFNYCI
jgi:hypothetical protein